MEGTPARLLTAMRTDRVSRERAGAYSCRYTAVATPTGTTATVISNTMASVPNSAGKIPPWVIPSVGAVKKNESDSRRPPCITTSPRITARIISTSKMAAPELTASAKSPARLRMARTNGVDRPLSARAATVTTARPDGASSGG